MLSAFLPLILLGYGTVQFEGAFNRLPLTAFLIWSYFSVVLFQWYLPRLAVKWRREYYLPTFMLTQNVFQSVTVAWILALQILVSPARYMPSIYSLFPQAFPMLLSGILYVGIFRITRRSMHSILQPILDPEQTNEDYFRARMSLPILFFPPMLLWVGIEDLTQIWGDWSGFSDFHAFLLAPLFFVALYLMAPRLFNWAWRASPMEQSQLHRNINELAQKAQTPVSGVRIWDTFREPVPNAAVAGLSARYRFVYVTRYLLEIFNRDQLLAVVAHELGHLRLGHVWTYLLFSLDLVFFSLLIKIVTFVNFPQFYRMTSGYDSIIDLLLFLVIFSVFFTAVTRFSEHQADRFAASLVGSDAIAGTLDTLEGYVSPPPAIFPKWSLTHPDFVERILKISEWHGTINDLIGEAKKMRRFLLGFGLILLAASLSQAGFIFRIHLVEKHIDAGNLEAARMEHEKFPDHHFDHPEILRLSARLSIASENYLSAVEALLESEYGIRLTDGKNSEVFKHSSSPKIAFYFQFVQFLLKSLDLRRVHGVSLFDETLNHLKIAFGQV